MVKKVLGLAFVWTVLALLYAPIIVLIVFSFTTSKANGVWSGFSFQNYAVLMRSPDMLAAVGNTLLIAVVSTVIATFLGTLAAVGMTSMRKTPKAILSGANQIPILNADIVTALALYIFFQFVEIPGGYLTLIIAHTLICTPYVVLAVLPRLSTLDNNLYEAALDLGSSPTRALFTVIIPQLIPSMISGALLAFTLSLDDFVITQYNKGTSSNIDTISTYIYTHMRFGLDPAFRALSALIFLVVLGVLAAVNVRNAKLRKNAI
jgi:spermidine/putrescine transport system permease protein